MNDSSNEEIFEEITLDLNQNQALHERETQEGKIEADVTSPITHTVIENARPSRTRILPKKLKDYVVNLPKSMEGTQENGAVNMIMKDLQNSEYYSEDYSASLNNVLKVVEPLNYKEAEKHEGWILTMQKEVQALEENGT